MRYIHTNLVARDWRRLAAFYEVVFGCTVQSHRDLVGDWLERASGVRGAHIEGAHLTLPGYDATGPTLEIFQYQQPLDGGTPAPNRLGFGHLAFQVEDVSASRERVLAHGGSAVGTIESVSLGNAGTITWTYVRDPEGNIIELQRRD